MVVSVVSPNQQFITNLSCYGRKRFNLCSCNVRDLSLYKRDFDKLLLEAVDEGLSSLGESSRQAIYYHLNRSFNIRKEEIPNRIIAFTQAIESIFGVGAHLVEILVMRRLREKVGAVSFPKDWERFGLVECVTLAKRVAGDKGITRTGEELAEN
jgi:hypothetical protein